MGSYFHSHMRHVYFLIAHFVVATRILTVITTWSNTIQHVVEHDKQPRSHQYISSVLHTECHRQAKLQTLLAKSTHHQASFQHMAHVSQHLLYGLREFLPSFCHSVGAPAKEGATGRVRRTSTEECRICCVEGTSAHQDMPTMYYPALATSQYNRCQEIKPHSRFSLIQGPRIF